MDNDGQVDAPHNSLRRSRELQVVQSSVGPLAESLASEATTSNTEYYHADHLGSSRFMTNASGGVVPNSEGTFLPFGQEFTPTTNNNHFKFTGKERDTESGFDYFGARYYGSGMGRWLTPDWSDSPTTVPYADFNDPQTLNLYSYVRNNPPNLTDPDGHLIPWLHEKMTFEILRSMGYSDVVANGVASRNSEVDDKYQDEAHAAYHSQGRRVNGRDQTGEEARRDEMRHVDAAIEFGAEAVMDGQFGTARQQLGMALHAVQDEKHGYTPYRLHPGNGSDVTNLMGAEEVRTDAAPTPGQRFTADRRTRETVQRFEEAVRRVGRARRISEGEISERIYEFRNNAIAHAQK